MCRRYVVAHIDVTVSANNDLRGSTKIRIDEISRRQRDHIGKFAGTKLPVGNGCDTHCYTQRRLHVQRMVRRMRGDGFLCGDDGRQQDRDRNFRCSPYAFWGIGGDYISNLRHSASHPVGHCLRAARDIFDLWVEPLHGFFTQMSVVAVKKLPPRRG